MKRAGSTASALTLTLSFAVANSNRCFATKRTNRPEDPIPLHAWVFVELLRRHIHLYKNISGFGVSGLLSFSSHLLQANSPINQSINQSTPPVDHFHCRSVRHTEIAGFAPRSWFSSTRPNPVQSGRLQSVQSDSGRLCPD
ncbi:hypothetical protein F5Y10DRAFT_207854 [Nemania abortiva]|nr:hypothetical protein F5Y10DRAFT_207854 [Nemania abortiva]